MDSKETQIQSSLSQEDEACLKAMLLCSSHVLHLVLNAAIELDLFGIMAGAGPGPEAKMSPSDIASLLPIKTPNGPCMLDRMLRLFASYSLLTCSTSTSQDGKVERFYGLTPTAKFFIRDRDKNELASLYRLHCHPTTLEVWYACIKFSGRLVHEFKNMIQNHSRFTSVFCKRK